MEDQALLYRLQSARIKRWIVFTLLLVAMFLVISWLYNRAFIEVNVSQSSTNEKYTYTLTNQESGKKYSIETASPNVKKLVSRGNYEITVSAGSKTSINIVKTGRLFQTSHVTARLASENLRQFIGNNPGNCVNYDGNLLYSYVCNSSINSLRVHHPSTTNEPTYTTSAPYTGSDVLNILRINNKDMVFLYNPDQEGESAYYAYPLTPSLTVDNWVFLNDLNNDITYKIEPYLDGFIAYTNDFSDIKYYKDLTSSPVNIALDASLHDNDLTPIMLSSSGKQFVALYSSNPGDIHEHKEMGNEQDSTPEGKSNLILYNTVSAKPSSFRINKPYYSIQICGQNRVCLLNSEGLDVYDISRNKVRLVGSVVGVDSMKPYGKRLIVVQHSRVIDFDVQNMSGYISYKLGDYKFCGLHIVHSGYIVCITNQLGNNSALYVNPSEVDKDSIDSKVRLLLDNLDVSDVSIYKNIIYISPYAGKLEYRPELQGFGYNPNIVKESNDSINNEIERLRIDRSKYQIINTLGSQ